MQFDLTFIKHSTPKKQKLLHLEGHWSKDNATGHLKSLTFKRIQVIYSVYFVTKMELHYNE